jgi:4-alpha-glucanotransferase
MTTPSDLKTLAKAAGLAVDWTDFRGAARLVPEEALRIILGAMGLPADTKGDISASRERLAAESKARAPLITAVRGGIVRMAGRAGVASLTLESGERRDIRLVPDGRGQVSFRAPRTIGYHHIALGDESIGLAVAPSRALDIADLTGGRKAWGVSAQLYSLNEGGAFGDFGDLAHLATRLGGLGADAVAVSPVHALFAADLGRYAPYGPSTRLFLSPLYAPAGTRTNAPAGA